MLELYTICQDGRGEKSAQKSEAENGKDQEKYDADFKKNAVKLSYASPKPVKEIAEDLGIHENMLYNWRRKYTADGDKTKYATLEEEDRDLQRQLAEVKMERDMLKKAVAYFASHQK